MSSEAEIPEPQRQLLNMVRAVILTKDAKVQTDEPLPEVDAQLMKSRTLTIFALASHLSAESLKLGVEPSSVFKTFASLNKRRKSSAMIASSKPPSQPVAAAGAATAAASREMSDLREVSFMLAETPDIPEDMLRKISVLDASDPNEVCFDDVMCLSVFCRAKVD